MPGQALAAFIAARHQQFHQNGLLGAVGGGCRPSCCCIATRRIIAAALCRPPLLQQLQAGMDAAHQLVSCFQAARKGGAWDGDWEAKQALQPRRKGGTDSGKVLRTRPASAHPQKQLHCHAECVPLHFRVGTAPGRGQAGGLKGDGQAGDGQAGRQHCTWGQEGRVSASGQQTGREASRQKNGGWQDA